MSVSTLSPRERLRILLRWLLAAIFLYAGYVHVSRPDFFLPIVPDWVPLPRETVILTGWCEVAGAIGLVVPRLRWFAGLMLALYAVCVFPRTSNMRWSMYASATARSAGGITRRGWPSSR